MDSVRRGSVLQLRQTTPERHFEITYSSTNRDRNRRVFTDPEFMATVKREAGRME